MINKRSPLQILRTVVCIWNNLWENFYISRWKVPTKVNIIWGLIFRGNDLQGPWGLIFKGAAYFRGGLIIQSLQYLTLRSWSKVRKLLNTPITPRIQSRSTVSAQLFDTQTISRSNSSAVRAHTNGQTDGWTLPITLSPCFAKATQSINIGYTSGLPYLNPRKPINNCIAIYTPSKKKLLACSTWILKNWGVTFFGQCSHSCAPSGHFKICKWKGEEFLFWVSVLPSLYVKIWKFMVNYRHKHTSTFYVHLACLADNSSGCLVQYICQAMQFWLGQAKFRGLVGGSYSDFKSTFCKI